MAKVTATAQPKKLRPKKPYEGFPLYPHGTGRWAKKIHGRVHYFGPWDKWRDALTRFNLEKDYLYAGEDPPKDTTTDRRRLVLRDLCSRYMEAMERRVDGGELSRRSLLDMRQTTAAVLEEFGAGRSVESLSPTDFEVLREAIGKRRKSLSTRGNEINRVRMVFKWAWDNRLIDKPMNFGTEFKRPSKRVLRVARAEAGEQMVEADEIRKLIRYAKPSLRAMILLGVNCGLGNADCGRLQPKHLNRKTLILDFPRPKTGVARRSKLWPITLAAIEAAEKQERRRNRKTPISEDAVGKLFVTSVGRAWYREDKAESPITLAFGRLARSLDIYRPGMSFYSLRRTCETIGGECGDQVAVDLVMGHVDLSMAATYRQRISDERLERVAQTIHDWLWPAIVGGA